MVRRKIEKVQTTADQRDDDLGNHGRISSSNLLGRENWPINFGRCYCPSDDRNNLRC